MLPAIDIRLVMHGTMHGNYSCDLLLAWLYENKLANFHQGLSA
jgi:hypothetical protein